MWGTSVTAADAADNLGGLVGMAARAIDAMGEWGVGRVHLHRLSSASSLICPEFQPRKGWT